jgi:hypothetical protein
VDLDQLGSAEQSADGISAIGLVAACDQEGGGTCHLCSLVP